MVLGPLDLCLVGDGNLKQTFVGQVASILKVATRGKGTHFAVL